MTSPQSEDWRAFEAAVRAAADALNEADEEAEILVAVGGQKDIQLCNYAEEEDEDLRLLVAAPDPGADKVSDADLESRWGASRESGFSADQCAISSVPLTVEHATDMVTTLAAAHVASPSEVRVRSGDEIGKAIVAACLSPWAT